MSVLGSVGQLYMFVLLILLFLGSGFALWSFINFIISRKVQKTGPTEKKPVLNQESGSNKNNFIQNITGGLVMNNSGWLKLAVFSFVGILVSVVILGFVSTSSPAGGNIHQQQQQQGNMNMQGGMNVNTQMGNMQMQGGINGNMGMQNDGNIQQLLNQIQQQINQLQQQMNNGGTGGNMQMQQGGSSNMGGMGMMGGMMGGMMNMGGMSSSGSMPQNNSGMSMPQSGNGANSSGSMSGMGMM